MTDVSVYTVVASVAAVLGLIAGRAFAVEGANRLIGILAAAYVSAGVGLMSSILIGPVLSLAVQYMNEGSATWFNALEVAGRSLLWGTAAGAAGGLAIGVVVAILPAERWKRPQ